MGNRETTTDLSPAQIVHALWADDGPAPELMAPDAVIHDQAQGAMSLRSFTALKRHLRAALPDHRAQIEDAFWSGSGGSARGLIRLIHMATHTRDGPLGPASYARLTFRSALRVQVQNTTVVEVAMIRDQTKLTAALSQRLGAFGKIDPNLAATTAIDHPWAAAYADILTAAMEGDFSIFSRSYAPTVESWQPGGTLCLGQSRAEQFWLALRAALPTARFNVLSGLGADDTMGPPRVGVEWRLTGQHLGWGLLGKPSQANLTVDGFSFAEFGEHGIHREWTVMDLPSLHRQVSIRDKARDKAA